MPVTKLYYRLLILFLLIACLPNYAIDITLEHAKTASEISWGLMGRKSLPENHGMAFSFDKPSQILVWMFNCKMDLSVAFLDNQHVIQEIHELKCFPEKMDPRRPVKGLNDLSKYPSNDPITKFFLRKGVTSNFSVSYMVEMPKGWFSDNHVEPGDRIVWRKDSPYGKVVKR